MRDGPAHRVEKTPGVFGWKLRFYLTTLSPMATKAEQFKSKMQRTGDKKAAEKPAAKKAATSKPKAKVAKESAPAAKDARAKKTASAKEPEKTNESASAARKAEVVLEESAGRPSRKSTRRSANRGKVASALERRAIRKARSPQTRAKKAAAAKKK